MCALISGKLILISETWMEIKLQKYHWQRCSICREGVMRPVALVIESDMIASKPLSQTLCQILWIHLSTTGLISCPIFFRFYIHIGHLFYPSSSGETVFHLLINLVHKSTETGRGLSSPYLDFPPPAFTTKTSPSSTKYVFPHRNCLPLLFILASSSGASSFTKSSHL